MLRSIAAVIGGFLAMAVVVMAGTMGLAAAFVPGGLAAMRDRTAAAAMTPTPRYLAMNLALSFVAAILGGWITSRIAGRAPAGHLVALAALMLVMGIVSAFGPDGGQQPSWYKVLIPVVGIAGIAASALFIRSTA